MAGEWRKTLYGPFAADFAECRLVELCDREAGIQTGPFGSQLHQEDYVEVGTPIITVEHLGENRILHQELPRVSDSDRDRLSRYLLRQGDIVFSRVGSVDRRALVRSDEDGWMFSGRCLRVRPDPAKIDSGYLSYFFGLPSFKEHVRSIAVGATMPSLNTSLLSDLVIPYPSSIHEQRAIAHILGTLDDKIELNRRMSETLEQMARALFQAWFVDFEPVRVKMKRQGADTQRQDAKTPGRQENASSFASLRPGVFAFPPHILDLFPARLVDSELGEIPEGWEVKKLGDLMELAYGKALKAEDRHDGNIPVFGSNGQVGWHDERLVKGPGIVVGRKGNPGVATWVPTDFFPIDTTFYVVPKPICRSLAFLFYALQFHDLASLGADSAVPGLNRNLAYMSLQLLPSPTVLERFDAIFRELYERSYTCSRQSRTLAALRDALLPKLISGALRVKDAEKFIGRVV
ncbi:MAG TPA: hypothetical protein DCL15_03190 [Chloroflexi bacterium]|nr:hypothetical protein [Chloroflexota bacterium]HHW88938.1 hypothetical protein [Chloroflexota bacterium]